MAGTALQRRLTWQLAEVVDTVDEARGVRSLVFDVPHWPGHLAGQHVDVRLTAADGYQTQRSYSVATSPDEANKVALTIERLDDGEVSTFLVDEVRVGDKLELRGPVGGYFVWDIGFGGPLLLIAGGSGIVPLMSMLRLRAARPSAVAARLLYSARTIDDVIFRMELEQFASAADGLQVVQTLTRQQPERWSGYRRRIDTEMLNDVAFPASDNPLAYACGPTALVESVAEVLVKLGYDENRIRLERFGPTGS